MKQQPMKPDSSRTRRNNGLPPNLGNIPMEWMDPMSWRLPSGKALAEFALQAGFLAPLILHGPRVKVRKCAVAEDGSAAGMAKKTEETGASNGAQAGGFRGTRL